MIDELDPEPIEDPEGDEPGELPEDDDVLAEDDPTVGHEPVERE